MKGIAHRTPIAAGFAILCAFSIPMCRPPSAAGPSSSDSKSIPNAPLDRYSVCSSNTVKHMNTQDLAEKIAEAPEISKADARQNVDSVITTIGVAPATAEEGPITEFGNYVVRSEERRVV